MTASTEAALSVVATVYNEAATIDRLLDSLAAQARRPDEVVVVDGGSTDDTWARLTARVALGDLPLVALARPGANISAGRNAAIAAARGSVIACTDAGVRLDSGWLAALSAPFAAGAQVVSGFFVAAPETAFETALGATTLPELGDVDPARFLPSSRSVAFLKRAWSAAGGYPEWLDYCEDLVFDFRLLAVAGPATFAPAARVHFRPRPTLAAFARQYYRYARGDGKANLWPARHAIRYGTYGGAALFAGLAWAVGRPAWLWALALGLAWMVRVPYRRLLRQWGALTARQRVVAALWVPVIRVTGDLAKMAGYPAGLLWRRRHRPPEWRPTPAVGRM
jgi:glycosyltransferase involved in cell wall biosynthesis